MDSDSPQDVYAKCLPNNRGYPLWFPEPSSRLPSSYRQDGLQIGDVGHVSRKGTFNVLLNVCFGPHHALHQDLGASFGFDPIKLIDRQVEVISNADPPGCVITSPGITQPSQTPQRDGYYEFTPSSAKGAILILPDGATSHDLPANERFRQVAVERAFDWYEVAKELYGESISSGSLYLVTGFYKARTWSLASFSDAAAATEPRHIRVMPRNGDGTTAGRDWKCSFPVQYRDGPGPGHNGSVNQTIFISGFKIAVRDDVLGWMSQKPEVQPVPDVRPRQRPCFSRFLKRLFGKKNTSKRPRRENRGADVKDVPALSQPFHPSDIINRYLLNKDPDALVAVTHDSEWIALIEKGMLTPEELTQENRLEEFLSENYSLVSQPENSAVYLQGKGKDQVVSPKSEEFWYATSSTDNIQVAITRVRVEDVIAGFRRMPVGFYILIQFNDTKRRTENKPVCLHENVVEWDDRIQLPSDPSAKVQLSVCASFEFSPMLGSGEILRTVEICVGDLLDNTHLFTFSPTEREPLSPCSSLLITMERQRSHKSGTASDHDEDFGWEVSSELAQITDQGHNALLRYRDDPRKENVAVSVGHFEHALSICPDGHRCYAAALCNLAMAHFINCQIDRGPVELSTAISYYREALKLRHVCHPDRPATLLHLAEVLLYRYGKLGFEDFPGEIMELTSEVQINCSADSHERRAADLALQTYTIYKAISSGSLVDIEKLIPALRQSVQHIPYEHFDKLQRLTNLGLALRICYELGGDLGDLDDSIATHEEAMQSIPCHHPYEPVLLTNLGVLFLGRFGQSGDHEDLSRSISLIEDAIRCTPHHHFDYAIRLTSLGNALLTRFQLLDDKEDLSRSTSVLEIAAWLTAQHPPNHPAACYTPWSNPPMFPVTPPTFPVTPPIHPAAWHTPWSHPPNLPAASPTPPVHPAAWYTPWSHPPNLPAASPTTPWLTPSPHLAPRLPPPHHPAARLTLPDNPVALPTQSYHPERPAVLVILAVSRFTQFYELDSQCDLNSAISTMDEALQLTPSGHFARPRMLSILSAFYFARFEISCDLADLDNSIFNIQEAIGLVPRGHFGRPKMVTALRSLVLIRLQMFDWAVDCDKSIGILEEIVQTTHDNDPSKPSSFAHLGTLFFIRFQQLNDLRDLDKAISTLKATLQLAIRRQLDPFELLMRLGVLFRVRFDKAGEVGDLERSVESIEDALALAPSGTESRSLFDAPEDPVSTF